MLRSFGSVPSSGRPVFEITEFTSGKPRSILRIRASVDAALESEMLGGRLMLIQTEPSFSSGRNSLPSRGTIARLTPKAATFVFTQFAGEPQCFLTETQLKEELFRAGWEKDPPGPLTEYNRPVAGRTITRGGPVIYEGTFRRRGRQSAARRGVKKFAGAPGSATAVSR
jgi:hypothetical protein